MAVMLSFNSSHWTWKWDALHFYGIHYSVQYAPYSMLTEPYSHKSDECFTCWTWWGHSGQLPPTNPSLSAWQGNVHM